MGIAVLESVFHKKHVFLAVVHIQDEAQAIRNSRIAASNGADGVFLINHGTPSRVLHNCYYKVRRELPNLWVGLNYLDLGRSAVPFLPKDLAGFWVDDAGIREYGDHTIDAEAFLATRRKSAWQGGLYFGGVAFKYQRQVANVAKVARLAIPFVDVITTSGEATGRAANVEKIKTMKAAIGDHPLAIASGITPENVGQYMPYADAFLVATGISVPATDELNPIRVRALADALGK